MTNLLGKKVILTGAGGGLGTYIGQRLCQEGAYVIGVDIAQLQLDAWSQALQAVGGKAFSVVWDLSASETLARLIEQIEYEHGPVDILINNAGVSSYRAFEDCSLGHMQDVLAINLIAAMELTRLLLPGFLARQQGHIVNIASLAAKMAHPYDSVYAASKAGLLLWSDSLRQELAHTAVKTSVVCPGYIAQLGMFANTHLPAPKLSGISPPSRVAEGVITAILTNRAELIVNQGTALEFSARATSAIRQLFPAFGDWVSHSLGVTELNRQRAIALKAKHQLASLKS